MHAIDNTVKKILIKSEKSMDMDTILNECKDPTKSITIALPCAMAERVIKLAEEKQTDLSNILIEALDTFLRTQE